MEVPPIRTDEQMIADYYAGDDRAFEELEKKYWRDLYALARTWKLLKGHAEDIAQSTLEKVAATKGTPKAYRPDQKARFRTWIFRIATNLMIDYTRKGHRRAGKESESELNDEIPHPWRSSVEARQIQNVRDCLETLPIKLKIVLLYIFWMGYKQGEVADMNGLSNAAITRIKKQALEKMEECLQW